MNKITSQFTGTESYEGETIEALIRRAMRNGEPIQEGPDRMYTLREDGVVNSTNIRADKFENLIEMTEKTTEIYRERRTKGQEIKKKEEEASKVIMMEKLKSLDGTNS